MNVSVSTREGRPFALSGADRARLAARLEEAIRRARQSGGEALAALTVPVAASVDPTAVALASRRAGEPWWVMEQPDRDRFALATLGEVRRVEAPARAHEDRFAAVARGWRELLAEAVADPPEGQRGAGLVATAGFAFAPDGGSAPHWSGFRPRRSACPRSRSRAGATGCASPLWPWRRPTTSPTSSWRVSTPASTSCGSRRCRWSTRRPRVAAGSSARLRRALRIRGGARGRSASARASSRRSCWRARSRCTRPTRTTRPPCSGTCARRSPPATSSAPGGVTAPSWPPAPSS